nr:hypothetical protein [uncultured Sphaerochaeta sp.]
MHSLIAYKLGLQEAGEYYLRQAMFLDLEELMENTSGEGLHIGAMESTPSGSALWGNGNTLLRWTLCLSFLACFLEANREQDHLQRRAIPGGL